VEKIIPSGGVILVRYVKKEKVRAGSATMFHGKWEMGKKSCFGKIHGWTIISLNLCFLDCIPYP